MSKIELSKWQNPEDGFPSEDYFDAVVVEMEKLGIGVHDSFRNEPWEFALILDRDAYRDGPVYPAHDVLVGWRVDEESDPLHQDGNEEWHGWHGSAIEPGWFWMRCKESGEGINPAFLDHPQYPNNPMDPLDEPEVIAAAVNALISPEPAAAPAVPAEAPEADRG